VQLGILGPFQLVTSDGQERTASARERDLLALLALHAGAVLSTDRLIDDLWGEELPANPGNALQQRIFHARRTLADDGELLRHEPGGYRLAIAPEQVDVGRFARARGAGQQASRDGDIEAALGHLQQALDLWRGEPLQGVRAPWATAAARRLQEEQLGTEEEWLDAILAAGRHGDAIPRLEDLTSRHPLRERFRGQLMRALAMAGRQAEALEVYERTRVLLADELGLDPSAALRAIHGDVLSQREVPPSVSAPPAVGRSPASAPTASNAPTSPGRSPGPDPTPLGSLPTPASSLVGRDDEVRRLAALLRSDRVVTVTGPGGVGKTRVAIAAAAATFEDMPVVMVELGAVVDQAAVPSVVVHALGLIGPAGTSPLTLLVTSLQHRRVHLLLDSCEHLVEVVCELVDQLTSGCPGVRVLATSREPLGVDGEVVWPLDPLPVPPADTTDVEVARRAPAVALLLERVRAAAPAHVLTDADIPPAVHIARELDGLPLAIELAAARARAMSLAEIAERLQDRFALLSGGRRSSPARHRALTATLEWSWDLLDEDDRIAWMAASVPVAPFTADLLASLLAGVSRVHPVDAVTALFDRSLLRLDQRGDPSRYAMLSTIREFGQQQLAASGVEVVIRDAHAAAVEAAVAAADRTTPTCWDLDLVEQRWWLPDVRAALRWRLAQSDRRSAQRLAARLGWLAFLTSLTAEGLRLLDLTIGPLDELEPDATEPAAVLWEAALRLGDARPNGMAWAQLAVEVADDRSQASLARGFVATYRALAGDVVGALELIRAEEPQEGWLGGMWRLLEGRMLMFLGDLDAAEAAVSAGVELLDAAGAWSSLLAGDILVHLAQLRGDAPTVRSAAERGLASCARHEAAELELELRCLLAMVEAADGEMTRADDELARAEELLERSGPAMTEALLSIATGYVRWRQGRPQDAEAAWTAALRVHHWTGLAYGPAFARWGLGHLALEAGDAELAASRFREALDEGTATGDHEAVATALEGLAAVAEVRGNHRLAALRLGAAAVRRLAMGAPAPLLTRELAGATRAAARDHLSEEGLADVEAVGATTDLEDLLAEPNARSLRGS
jgi:predicted ATPase/DNA-binding SARP family transcriptional activator